MLKKILLSTLLVGLIGILVVGAASRTLATQVEASGADTAWAAGLDGLTEGGRGGGGGGRGGWGGQGQDTAPAYNASVAPAAPLTAAETEALKFMREEEKLARDIYTALYAKWGAATFQSISQSEQAHMDALKTLLDRYGVADPASAQAGVFTNPDLQKLYDTLLAQGQTSLGDAYKVGALIEEVDIADLQARAKQTTNADLVRVFANLERGSDNHLRAYTRALSAATGETYAPQKLSAEAYSAIVTGSAGQGGGYHGGRP